MAHDWYKHAVLYQIYPRSFADANGDGVGDLAGITAKLDYLKDLGVDGLWLSPIYRSPMADFGYDISDYCDIDPTFGTLDDFDDFISAARHRGIKVIMDLVPNHTSDKHPWFEQSRSSAANPKRDWYIWKNAKADGTPPNNWQSVFGGPAWTYDPKTDQYYLHSFLKEQPDLNWSNPEVQAAIGEVMRFWYERGVDGFRVDAILFTSKDLEFRDNPVPQKKHRDVLGGEFETAFSHGVGKNLAPYIKVLTDVTKEYPGRCLFLEAYPDKGDPAGYASLYDYIDHDVAAPFYFALIEAEDVWKAPVLQRLIDGFQRLLTSDSFPVYVFGNHDKSRLASRIGPEPARAAVIAFLGLPGTKFIYYGEELGMKDVNVPLNHRVDPSPVPRDPERTPMRWTPHRYAGFSSKEPWLPIGDDVDRCNVETLLLDPNSILNLYRRMITLCHRQPALRKGSFEPLSIDNPSVYGYKRLIGEEELIIVINFTAKRVVVKLRVGTGEVLLSSTLKDTGERSDLSRLALNPHESLVLSVDR